MTGCVFVETQKGISWAILSGLLTWRFQKLDVQERLSLHFVFSDNRSRIIHMQSILVHVPLKPKCIIHVSLPRKQLLLWIACCSIHADNDANVMFQLVLWHEREKKSFLSSGTRKRFLCFFFSEAFEASFVLEIEMLAKNLLLTVPTG